MNQVYRYLLKHEHFQRNPIKRLDVCEALNISERDFRYQTAEIAQADRPFKVNFNSKGVYLAGFEELLKLRTRAINAIKREVVKVKQIDKVLNREGQVALSNELELIIERYEGSETL